jgi:exosome complex exonuclease DIS3/RRP44
LVGGFERNLKIATVSADADITYPSMLNKRAVEEVCHNLNYRHKQAQYCGRASVLLNTHLFFKDKVEELEGFGGWRQLKIHIIYSYVLSVRRNAIQVLIPKYGLESAIMLDGRGTKSPFVFDDETCTLRVATGPSAGVQLQMFDGVRVQLSLAVSADEQHQRLQLKLIEPKVDGFRFGLFLFCSFLCGRGNEWWVTNSPFAVSNRRRS